MDDFILPVISDTAAELLPQVALATEVTMETVREHGFRLNMASNKTDAVVDFRGVDANSQSRGGRLAQAGE